MCKKFFKEYEKWNGFEFSQEEKDYMIEQDYACDTCGNDFRENNDDFVVVEDEDRMICRDCYEDAYQTFCIVCEEMFDDPKSPEETILYVDGEARNQTGLPIGIYQVLKFPFFMCSILGGGYSLFDNSIKQVSNLNFKLLGRDIENGKLCPDCFEKYTGKVRLRNNYCNRGYGVNHIITKRGLIRNSLIQ